MMSEEEMANISSSPDDTMPRESDVSTNPECLRLWKPAVQRKPEKLNCNTETSPHNNPSMSELHDDADHHLSKITELCAHTLFKNEMEGDSASSDSSCANSFFLSSCPARRQSSCSNSASPSLFDWQIISHKRATKLAMSRVISPGGNPVVTSNRFQVLSDGSGFGTTEFDSTPGLAAEDYEGTMRTFLQPPHGGVNVRSQGSCSSQQGSRKGSRQGSRTNAARHDSLFAHGLGKDCRASKCADGDGPKISKGRPRTNFYTTRIVRFSPVVESISYPKGTPCETQFNLYELGSSSPQGCIDSNSLTQDSNANDHATPQSLAAAIPSQGVSTADSFPKSPPYDQQVFH